MLHYLEGWHLVAEANRIFGFDGWDRETVSSNCVYTKQIGNRYWAAYVTRVRIIVRAGDERIVREGCGAGESNAASPGQAHEFAAKASETDATKRALSTFGNAFGLSLYANGGEPAARRTEEGPRAAESQKSNTNMRPESRLPATADASTATPKEVLGGQTDTIAAETPAAPEVAREISLAEVKRMTARRGSSGEAAVTSPEPASTNDITHSAAGSNGVGPGRESSAATQASSSGAGDRSLHLSGTRVDKSVLAIAEPRRLRDPNHLRFVASQPCLICERQPAEAHHLKFAQPTALGRKVSDAFTVPLCSNPSSRTARCRQ